MRIAGGGSAPNLALSIVIISIVLTCIISGAAPLISPAAEAQSPPLTISKSASPDPAVAGGELTYVLIITNTSTMALTGVVVGDNTPNHTVFLGTSGPDYWLMTSPAYGGEGAVTWIAPTPLEPGQTVQLKFLVRVETPDGEPIVNSQYEVRADGLDLPVIGEPVTTTVILPTPTFTPPPTVPPTPTPIPTVTPTPTASPTATTAPKGVKAETTQSVPFPPPESVGQSGLQNMGKIVIVLVIVGLIVVSAAIWVAKK